MLRRNKEAELGLNALGTTFSGLGSFSPGTSRLEFRRVMSGGFGDAPTSNNFDQNQKLEGPGF